MVSRLPSSNLQQVLRTGVTLSIVSETKSQPVRLAIVLKMKAVYYSVTRSHYEVTIVGNRRELDLPPIRTIGTICSVGI